VESDVCHPLYWQAALHRGNGWLETEPASPNFTQFMEVEISLLCWHEEELLSHSVANISLGLSPFLNPQI
jgi:hypothetical protein